MVFLRQKRQHSHSMFRVPSSKTPLGPDCWIARSSADSFFRACWFCLDSKPREDTPKTTATSLQAILTRNWAAKVATPQHKNGKCRGFEIRYQYRRHLGEIQKTLYGSKTIAVQVWTDYQTLPSTSPARISIGIELPYLQQQQFQLNYLIWEAITIGRHSPHIFRPHLEYLAKSSKTFL